MLPVLCDEGHTKDGLGALEKLHIKLLPQLAFALQELGQDFVVDTVSWEKLFEGKRTLIGQRNGVYLAVLGRVLQLHI